MCLFTPSFSAGRHARRQSQWLDNGFETMLNAYLRAAGYTVLNEHGQAVASAQGQLAMDAIRKAYSDFKHSRGDWEGFQSGDIDAYAAWDTVCTCPHARSFALRFLGVNFTIRYVLGATTDNVQAFYSPVQRLRKELVKLLSVGTPGSTAEPWFGSHPKTCVC